MEKNAKRNSKNKNYFEGDSMSIEELNSEEDVILTQKEIHTASREVHIDVVQGDITTREVDAIVNAAHEGLTGFRQRNKILLEIGKL